MESENLVTLMLLTEVYDGGALGSADAHWLHTNFHLDRWPLPAGAAQSTKEKVVVYLNQAPATAVGGLAVHTSTVPGHWIPLLTLRWALRGRPVAHALPCKGGPGAVAAGADPTVGPPALLQENCRAPGWTCISSGGNRILVTMATWRTNPLQDAQHGSGQGGSESSHVTALLSPRLELLQQTPQHGREECSCQAKQDYTLRLHLKEKPRLDTGLVKSARKSPPQGVPP